MRMLLSFQRPPSLSERGFLRRRPIRPSAQRAPSGRPGSIALRTQRVPADRALSRRAGAGSGACRPSAPAPSARSHRHVVLAGARAGRSSSVTPPWSISRRASEREMPNASAITPGRCTVPVRRRPGSAPPRSPRAPRAPRTPGRSGASAAAPARASAASDELARQRALGVPRRELLGRRARGRSSSR